MKSPILIVLIVLVAVAAAPGQTCIPGIELITQYTWEPGGPVSVCVTPESECRVFVAGGQEVAAVLRFPVAILPGWPVPETVPVEWWNSGPAVFCGGTLQQADRAPDGWVTVLPGLRGGGSSDPAAGSGVELWVPVCPNQLLELETSIRFNSPDLNGDLSVDLSDVPIFAGDVFGPYAYRSDFNWDGQVNLTDVVFLAQSLGETCQ